MTCLAKRARCTRRALLILTGLSLLASSGARAQAEGTREEAEQPSPAGPDSQPTEASQPTGSGAARDAESAESQPAGAPVQLGPLGAALEASPAPSPGAPTRMELARRVEILTEEVQQLKEQLVLPETEELKSSFGLGPAASRIYRTQRGISFGGYGEFHLEQKTSDSEKGEDFSIGDYLRYVQYIGYKFTDKLLINVELEFEHATTGTNFANQGGSVSVEFASLEYLVHPWINVRAGILLLPVGFINEIHEPPFFHGNLRPLVETRIIPTTWRELGLGVFGEPMPGLTYKLYGVTGMNAEGFDSETGWRGGRQSGNRVLAEDFAAVLSLSYAWRDLLQIAGSVYYGGADQDRLSLPAQGALGEPGELQVNTLLTEAHVQLRWRGLEFRGLIVYGALSKAAKLSRIVYPELEQADDSETRLLGNELYGWYVELAYDLWPWLRGHDRYLAPYVRYEELDTQADVPEIEGRARNPASQQRVIEAGLTFKPHPQIALKASYRNLASKGEAPVPDSFYFGAGFIY